MTEQNCILTSTELIDLPEERPDITAAVELVFTADTARTTAVEQHTNARRAQSEIRRLAGEHQEGEDSLMQKLERD